MKEDLPLEEIERINRAERDYERKKLEEEVESARKDSISFFYALPILGAAYHLYVYEGDFSQFKGTFEELGRGATFLSLFSAARHLYCKYKLNKFEKDNLDWD